MFIKSFDWPVCSQVDGILCSFEEAIPQLIFFQKKSQGSANWNSMLEIGPHFRIPVTGRIKVPSLQQLNPIKIYYFINNFTKKHYYCN